MYRILEFLIFYPIIISLFWLVGSLFYYFTKEIFLKKKPEITHYTEEHGITFMVPCYNEAPRIEETVRNLMALSYPYKEIIVVNDGSTDNSSEVLTALTEKLDFKLIDLKENKGKSNALNTAVKHSDYAYVMVIDADTIMDDSAPYYMMENFYKYKYLGAVTANPRIRNKSTLLGKIQTVEYASIIGSIKRAQLMNGFINTVSGVCTLYNKAALKSVGYFDNDMITEDIAVSWKMHFQKFKIQYEPRALCWMFVPESIIGLLQQRTRWSQGSLEVLIRDARKMLKVKNPAFWLLFFEQVLSVVWVLSIMSVLIFMVININFLDYYFYTYNMNLVIFSAFVLTFVNIIQFIISLCIDSKYEKKNIWMVII
jgi:biofilm PGA synthesis N-glycosyltransferase PgaC